MDVARAAKRRGTLEAYGADPQWIGPEYATALFAPVAANRKKHARFCPIESALPMR